MKPTYIKVSERLLALSEEALDITKSRLQMARAASHPDSRQQLERLYDRLWTLACRVSRAISYRGKHARRMRKRLVEGSPFAAITTFPDTSLPTVPMQCTLPSPLPAETEAPATAGPERPVAEPSPTPTKRRKSKRQIAEEIRARRNQ